MTESKLDTMQPVELTEGVVIHVHVAGPAARSTAWFIDLLISLCVYIAVGILLSTLGAFGGEQLWNGVMLLFFFLYNWFYNVFFELGRHSATPGQRHMGLKVASSTGGPVRFSQSLIRNLLRTIDFMPACYLLGFICCLCNKRFQRLGDLAADTVVIHAPAKEKVAPDIIIHTQPQPPPQALSRAEQAAILQFLERAPLLSDARQIELSDTLSPLTGSTGTEGLRRLYAIGLWLSQGQQRPVRSNSPTLSPSIPQAS